MKYSELVESKFLTDKDKILKWLEESFFDFKPNKLTIESDGLVYDGDLLLNSHVSKFYTQFKSITGNFYVNGTKLTSLEGSPKIVDGNFICYKTNITSLKFCPISVGIGFYCPQIKITDPKEYRYALYSEIGGLFNSSYIKINEIINSYSGVSNRKYWPTAINLLSKVKL